MYQKFTYRDNEYQAVYIFFFWNYFKVKKIESFIQIFYFQKNSTVHENGNLKKDFMPKYQMNNY